VVTAGHRLRSILALAAVGLMIAASTALAGERSAGSPRIVGGDDTTIEDWPWQVAIADDPEFEEGDGFDRQFCGGSLVAPTIVITAAHCVHDGDEFTNPDLYTAITGRTTLSSTEGQEIEFARYYYFVDGSGNPLFNPDSFEWDTVFVELADASSSTPVQIAGANEVGFWAPGEDNAWATGWGTQFFAVGPRSDTLQEVNIDVIADSFCSGATSYGSSFDPETMLCAGETAGGQDTCQGDSGGPLVTPIGGGTFRLIGDTSWGNGCATPNFPGVYGRLAQHPMCSALQSGIQSVAGVDVVGPGGCLDATGTPAGFAAAGSGSGGPTPPPVPGPVPDPGGGGDAQPPETAITKGPDDKTRRKHANFAFNADEPATFRCTVDGREVLQPCESPITVKVKKGNHTFQVQATDRAGNVDSSPASDSWKVKKKRRS
jgi:hypothetical protein